MGNTYTGSNSGQSGLEVTDGTTTGFGINKITVTAGDLTSASNGAAVIDTSGGGAGVDSITFGTTGLTPNTATTGVVSVAGTLVVANGGTGATTLTDGGILLGSGTGVIIPTAQPASGQLLIGSSGADPVLATITSGGGTITITGGAGTLDIELTNTAVTPAAYTSANITVDAQGRITAAGSGSAAAITATANGANDRIATYSAATELNGEANLTFSGSLFTVTGSTKITTDLEIDGDLNHDGSAVGFFGVAPAAQQNVPSVPIPDPGANQAAINSIIAAFQALGLFS